MKPKMLVIDEVINRLLLYPGSTIRELAKGTGYSEDTVFSAINDLRDNPWNGIELTYNGYIYSENDLYTMERVLLYETLRWELKGKVILLEDVLENEDYLLLDFIQNKLNEKEKGSNVEPIIILALNQVELPDDENIAVLSICIRQMEWVRIEYKGPRKTLYISLFPMRLVFHRENGQWYLLGMDESRIIQLFRLKRISKLERTGKKENKPVDEFHYPERSTEVKLKVFPKGNVLEAVRNTLGTVGIQVDNESVLFTTSISDVNGFVRWIRGFGCAIEVISPESIRKRIITGAKKTLDNYGRLDEFIHKVHN